MRIVETSVFTEQISELLSDDEYRRLQLALVLRPKQGPVIRGTGGVRKVRWGQSGSGKSGGVRIIYYWATAESVLFMLYAYPKGVQDDLTPAQRKALRTVVEEEFG